MNKYELFEAIGYISDRKIRQAEYYQCKKHKVKPILKYSGIALASITIFISSTVFIYERKEYRDSATLSYGNAEVEKTDKISIDKNSFIKYNNKKYFFTNKIISVEDIDILISSHQEVFHNKLQNEVIKICNVYSIKNESVEMKIAVEIDNEYYVFISDKDI